jgi:hypothetical protein
MTMAAVAAVITAATMTGAMAMTLMGTTTIILVRVEMTTKKIIANYIWKIINPWYTI